MKQRVLIFFITIIMLRCQIKPSNTILIAFKNNFPTATEIEWEKDNDQTWEVEFTIDEREYTADFDLYGKLLETEKQIDINEVPEIVMNAFKTKYTVSKIYKTYLEKIKSKEIYEFELSKEEDGLDIEIDRFGNFLIEED